MSKELNSILEIYTDGSCLGNPGPGGWAAVYVYNNQHKSISGYEAQTTNNRMELLAAINAIRKIAPSMIVDLHLYTDSTYVKNGITLWIEGWKKQNWRKNSKNPVKNIDLWEELDELSSKYKVTWHWVKAHNGNKYNEMADTLAKKAIKGL